jgi:hypothetical protein
MMEVKGIVPSFAYSSCFAYARQLGTVTSPRRDHLVSSIPQFCDLLFCAGFWNSIFVFPVIQLEPCLFPGTA